MQHCVCMLCSCGETRLGEQLTASIVKHSRYCAGECLAGETEAHWAGHWSPLLRQLNCNERIAVELTYTFATCSPIILPIQHLTWGQKAQGRY